MNIFTLLYPSGAQFGARVVAGHARSANVAHLWATGLAQIRCHFTARMKGATGWRVDRIAYFPFGWLDFAAKRIHARSGIEQHSGVGMQRGFEQPITRGLFNEPAQI